MTRRRRSQPRRKVASYVDPGPPPPTFVANQVYFDESRGRDRVAFVLAAGIAFTLIVLAMAAAIHSFRFEDGLTENMTQLLTGTISGGISGLAVYLGFRQRVEGQRRTDPPVSTPPPPPLEEGQATGR